MSVGKETRSANLEGLCKTTLAETGSDKFGELTDAYDPEDLTDFANTPEMIADFVEARLNIVLRQLPYADKVKLFMPEKLSYKKIGEPKDPDPEIAKVVTIEQYRIHSHSNVLETVISRAVDARVRLQEFQDQITALRKMDPATPGLDELVRTYTMEEVQAMAEALPLKTPTLRKQY